jgi:hypothetical protein
MTSLSPGDIVTKLRFLFIVVVVLFGFMNVGAGVAFVLDMRERRSTLCRLQAPAAGFSAVSADGGDDADDAVWTWACTQLPLTRAVEAPRGSAAALSYTFGLPLVRLRASLPECVFGDGAQVGHALGRKAGLSVQGLADAADDNVDAMSALASGFACCGGGGPGADAAARIPAFDASEAEREERLQMAHTPPARVRSMLRRDKEDADAFSNDADDEAQPPSPTKPDAGLVMAGTALVFAFMANAKTVPVTELSSRVAAAARHFAGVRAAGLAHDFGTLLGMFTVMLSPGNLSARGDWLDKARLWRLILLQGADGGWEAGDSLAFAVEAHAGPRPPRREKKGGLCATALAALADGDLDDALDEMADEWLSSEEEEDADNGAAAKRDAKAPLVTDCPLSFSHAAIKRRLPPALAALNDEHKAALREAAQAAAAAAAAAAAHAAREAARRRKVQRARDAAAAARDAAVAMQREALLQANPFHALSRVVAHLVEDAQPATYEQLRARVEAEEAAAHAELEAERAAAAASSALSSPRTQPPSAAPSSAASKHRRRLRGGGPPAHVPVERIWATALALNTLEDLDSCWLADEDASPEASIVDRGRQYLEAQARADKRVRKLLASGALAAAAGKARRDWRAIQEHNVGALRDADVVNKYTLLMHAQRVSARIVRSMMTDHSTFATFLDEVRSFARAKRRVFACADASFLACRTGTSCAGSAS